LGSAGGGRVKGACHPVSQRAAIEDAAELLEVIGIVGLKSFRRACPKGLPLPGGGFKMCVSAQDSTIKLGHTIAPGRVLAVQNAVFVAVTRPACQLLEIGAARPK
jgi:hypothetical protein